MMKTNIYGAFEMRGITFVPYRHYKNQTIWMVQIIDEYRVTNLHVASSDAEDAVRCAYTLYEDFLTEEMKYLEMRQEMKEEDLIEI